MWAAKWSLDVAISAAHLAEFRRRRGWGLFVGLVPGQEGTAELTAQPQREKTVMRAHSQPTGACMITEIDCQNNEQSGCLDVSLARTARYCLFQSGVSGT